MWTRDAAIPAGAEWGARPPLFRSGWEIAAMVGGFVAFAPVGLAILAYFLVRRHKAERGEDWSGTMWSESACARRKAEKAMAKAERVMARMGADFGGMRYRSSGNAAFDEYRGEVLRRLEEERRKLDEEQRAFGDFMLRLKRAKDQQEFDHFMAERNGSAPRGPTPTP